MARGLRIGHPLDPSWFTASNDATLGIIPGTAAGTIAAVMQGGLSGPESILTAWNSPVINTSTKELLLGGAGGHGDYAGNEFYGCSLIGETNAFRRVMDYSTSLNAIESQQITNGTNETLSGAMATFHTYGNVDYFGGLVYFTGGSASFSTGDPTSAIWTWAEADLANGRNGYTYHGKGAPSWVSGNYDPNMFDAWNAVDPVGGDVWQVPAAASGGSSSPGGWKINHATKTITTYTFATPYGFFPGWVVCIPALNILLACSNNGTSSSPGLWYLNLASPASGWTEITSVTGTPRANIGDAAVFDAANSKVYVYGGGTTLYKLSVPGSVGGTFAWSSTNLSGTAPTTYLDRWYKKMRQFTHTSGRSMLVFLGAYDAGVSYAKVPVGGF